MSRRWSGPVYALLVGLIGAGIVHIAILFLVPAMTDRDSWARLSRVAEPFAVVRVSAQPGAEPLVRAAGPLFEVAACRFDISEAILHVEAPDGVPFWSAAVYDTAGRNLYSFTDRTADGRQLDLVVLSPTQMIELRRALPEEFERSIIVESEALSGIVVVRAFVPDPSWRPTVLRFLESVSCQPR